MYSSTICFQRLRQSQPRKKLWTFLIFPMSGSSSSSSLGSHSRVDFDTCGRNLQSFFKAHNYKNNNNNKFNKIIFIYYYIGEVFAEKGIFTTYITVSRSPIFWNEMSKRQQQNLKALACRCLKLGERAWTFHFTWFRLQGTVI